MDDMENTLFDESGEAIAIIEETKGNGLIIGSLIFLTLGLAATAFGLYKTSKEIKVLKSERETDNAAEETTHYPDYSSDILSLKENIIRLGRCVSDIEEDVEEINKTIGPYEDEIASIKKEVAALKKRFDAKKHPQNQQ